MMFVLCKICVNCDPIDKCYLQRCHYFFLEGVLLHVASEHHDSTMVYYY